MHKKLDHDKTRIKLNGGLRTRGFLKHSLPDKPLITVITVVYNGETTITRCIECVIAQTYDNIEHIIIDGGSTDQTVNILRSYNDKIAFWISEPDNGIYEAMNKGIGLAIGRHYIPLGCDDRLALAGVECLARHASDNLVIRGLVKYVDVEHNFKKLIYNHSAGVLIDTRAHDQLGLYDETYRIAADTKFLQLAARASFVKNIDDVVGEYTIGGASSCYTQTIREHARAMHESGSWRVAKAFLWLAPRLVWAVFRRSST